MSNWHRNSAGTLNVGDTFLRDGRPFVVADTKEGMWRIRVLAKAEDGTLHWFSYRWFQRVNWRL